MLSIVKLKKKVYYTTLLVRRKSQITNLIIFTLQAKLLTLPQVFITPEIDPRLAVKLKDIVKRHNVRIHVV